jgi:hypothetical protein
MEGNARASFHAHSGFLDVGQVSIHRRPFVRLRDSCDVRAGKVGAVSYSFSFQLLLPGAFLLFTKRLPLRFDFGPWPVACSITSHRFGLRAPALPSHRVSSASSNELGEFGRRGVPVFHCIEAPLSSEVSFRDVNTNSIDQRARRLKK